MNPVELEQQRIHYVRVTNGLPFPFTDRHDGVPVTIMPGKSENLPLDMAAHFFGYHPAVEPETMFRHIAKRQGWNTPEYVKQNPDTHKNLAQEYFEKLKIEAVAYKLVPVADPDPRKPVPADPEMPAGELLPTQPRPRPKRGVQTDAEQETA
jgi:hypothetical protein